MSDQREDAQRHGHPCGLVGPLTAQQAWAAALPHIRSLDPAFRLKHIHSGMDFSADGRSKAWSLTFRLAAGTRVLIDVLPCPTWDVDEPQIPMCVKVRLRPAMPGRPERAEPALPVPFRDTPEVARAFEAQGVDLGAGPSDMMVQGVIAETGQAVWLIHCWDRPFTTPFVSEQDLATHERRPT